MSDVTVKILGLEELQHTLEAMPRDVSRKVVREDLKKAGELPRVAMVDGAPKKSGFLSEHFDVKVQMHAGGIAGTAFVGPQGKVYYPGGDERLGPRTGKHPWKGGRLPAKSVARFLEFGTSRMSPHPFMRRAFEQTKSQAVDVIVEGIREGIKKWTK